MPDAPVVSADTSLLGGAAAAVPPADANAVKPADPAGAQPAVVDDKAKPADAPAPELKYEFKTPDGIDLKDMLPKYAEIAKELKLPPEQAQKLLDWYATHGKERQTSAEAEWKSTNDGWVKAAEADKEIGGDAFKNNVEQAKLAISKFGNKQLMDALNLTGMGNHPEMIRFFFKVSQAFKEDNLQGGSPAANAQPKSVAEVLFGNSK